MGKTRRKTKTEREEAVSYSRDPISDATIPQPTHRPPVEVSGVANVYPSKEELADRGMSALAQVVGFTHVSTPLPMTEAESPEKRTAWFRDLHLVAHRGGVMACNHCHFAPYYCIACAGLKCRCKVAGVYRHWENGVPIASFDEQRLLEDVSL
jgi:hypothetical protein